MSAIRAAQDVAARVPTRRTLAKQQTRQKVLAAARKLFSEEGYEGATIRDIAAAAGMSTGAVFANFTDKSDLFREIMTTDMACLLEAMRQAATRGRGVEDALVRIFMAGYLYYKDQLPLARAAFSVSWLPQDGPPLRAALRHEVLSEVMSEQLALGVERGELVKDAEITLRGQMLFGIYLSNYQHMIFGGWSLEALQARARDQIRILLAAIRCG